MNEDQKKLLNQIVMPTLAALFFLVGAATIIGTLTFHAVPAAFQKKGEGVELLVGFPWLPWTIAGICLLLALVTAIWTVATIPPPDRNADARAVSDAAFT